MSSNFQQSIYRWILDSMGFHRVQEHPKRSSLLSSILILIFLPFTCSLLRIYYYVFTIPLLIYFSFHYILCTMHYALHYALCIIYYALYTMYFILCTMHYVP